MIVMKILNLFMATFRASNFSSKSRKHVTTTKKKPFWSNWMSLCRIPERIVVFLSFFLKPVVANSGSLRTFPRRF